LLVAGACQDGGGDARVEDVDPTTTSSSTTTPAPSGLPPCSEARQLAVFDVFGTLTMDDQDLFTWLADPDNPPALRPGAVELVAAYRERGYEILYASAVPPSAEIGGEPFGDALVGWLAGHLFAVGEGTQVFAADWSPDDPPEAPSLRIAAELARLATEGVTPVFGYTDNDDKALALMTGSIAKDHVFTLGAAAGSGGSTPVPDDDLRAHLATVTALDAVCAGAPAAAP
jgi:hypothetical protein